LQLRFAKRSSTRAGLLVGAVAVGAVVAAIGLAAGAGSITAGGLAGALAAAGAFAIYLIVNERRRHEVAEEELVAQATFLEALIDSMGRIAATRERDDILERTRQEAKLLFKARASLLGPNEAEPKGSGRGNVVVPLHVGNETIAALRLERDRSFDRGDVVRATVLADFAGRVLENAGLLAEAQVREAERGRLSDQLITAEQDERRRIALFLHDGPVQNLSGIALLLDAAAASMVSGRTEEAKQVMTSALERHRETIRSLRDLSFNLEPVVLRDQGFAPAVRELADQLGLSQKIQIDVDVDKGEALAEKAQVGLYQIIREALHQAIRRGPPTRIAVRIAQRDGAYETTIVDDGTGERRRRSFEAIEERARTLNGRVEIDAGEDGGTRVRVVLPGYAARG
jgi:signal transduction histidine kinase